MPTSWQDMGDNERRPIEADQGCRGSQRLWHMTDYGIQRSREGIEASLSSG